MWCGRRRLLLDTDGALIPVHPQDWVAILIFLPVALLANVLAGQARLRAAESDLRRREAEVSHAEASALAQQQAALRRVATMVARGVDPSGIYPAAVAEPSRGLGIDNVALLRYETGQAVLLLATCDARGSTRLPVGERLSLDGDLDGDNVAAIILDTGKPARMDCLDDTTGSTADLIRGLGLRSAIGAPIIVDGRTWGVLVIGSSQAERCLPKPKRG